MRNHQSGSGLVDMAGLALLCGLLIAGFLHVFSPARPLARPTADDRYNRSAMDAAMAPASVSNQLQAILACGSRFQGQPGLSLAQQRVRAAFVAAGLEIHELSQSAATVHTLAREIRSRSGELLQDVEIYPFLPNLFQPVVTPEAGCTATLVLATDELLRTRDTFTNCIAVIDFDAPPESYGLNWVRYAQSGFQGVIVAHRKGLDRIRWGDFGTAISSWRDNTPVNYLRLAATPGVFAHLGETVTVRVKMVWEESCDPTLIGILHAPHPADEALVITSCADAPSILPDLAPGTLSAVNQAAQLALLQGICASRDDPHRTRDLIFVSYSTRMMGLLAADELTSVLGHALDRKAAGTRLVAEQLANRRQQLDVAECQGCFPEAGFLVDAAATGAKLAALSSGARAVFDSQFRVTMDTLLLERAEVQLQARLAFLRTGGRDTNTAAYARYRAARESGDEGLNLAGVPVRKLLEADAARAFVAGNALRARLAARLGQLAAFHAAREACYVQALAIHRQFASYRRLIAMGAFLAPADPAGSASEKAAFHIGLENTRAQLSAINELIGSTVQHAGAELPLAYEPLREHDHNAWARGLVADIPVDVQHWSGKGYPAFVLVNAERVESYQLLGSPVDELRLHRLGSIEQSLRLLGRLTLALAYGQGGFDPPAKSVLTTYSGCVYLSNVGRSIIPAYPLAGALVGHKLGRADGVQGFYRFPLLMTDPYGRYALPTSSGTLLDSPVYSPEAVAFGPDGVIRYCKDEGPQGQRIYQSIHVGTWGNRANINIVAFRAAPVTLFDTINPQTRQRYSGFDFLTRDGLTKVAKYNCFARSEDLVTTFLEPDCRFFITCSAGSPENEKVKKIQAFLLGAADPVPPDPEREIDGPGYLAADAGALAAVPRQIARSMKSVDDRRLDLQQRYHMADERTCRFQRRIQSLLEASEAPGTPQHAADLQQRAAVTYATLNHPVLRDTIGEAVAGILWYLGLLVPFAFFFEKLALGCSDIRRQLMAQAAIFLVVFVLLRILHPAFAMIHSSLMILLGFVILLISGGITVLFAGKFRENLEELQKQRGQVTAAAVNTIGVLGTAFALGLNNMHRRIVRTGLTCATLVLLTFAMICFTSVQSDVLDTAVATGRAPYQGLLVKYEQMKPIQELELFALRNRYEPACAVIPRRIMVGRQGVVDRVCSNPELDATYEPVNDLPKRQAVSSILELGARDPLQKQIRLLTQGGWFSTNRVAAEVDLAPVLIADGLAAALGLRPADVDHGRVIIKINGRQVRVHGIFDAASLAAVRDLDGRDILPFDVEAMRSVRVMDEHVLADDDAPRLATERMVIFQENPNLPVRRGDFRLISVAVCMPGLSYRQTRDEATQYLEQSGLAASYGLGTMAYRGRCARARTAGGLLELLIPLVIAALTVLNTMRGSVYERSREIHVYNAVGIAPRYIFAMFFSEAFVYSVVGSVLGFLLSQGLGCLLTRLGWTGGLTMTFTSLSTIYASLAVMAAVFLSTLFPARTAMRIAAPADDAGWKLPEPQDDRMSFALPFTFHAQDRIAVLAFFSRYFADHGEGSAGRFFAAAPQLLVRDDAACGACVPGLATTIWLKPFDLGTSQRLEILMPVDAETGEFAACVTLRRLSGTRESWVRLNQTFVAELRQHFLYWRAVGSAERRALFTEARQKLEQAIGTQEHPHA